MFCCHVCLFGLLLFGSSSGTNKNEKQDIVDDGEGGGSNGHILRHFFDDWPRSLQEPDNGESNNGSCINSATCLSISMPGNNTSNNNNGNNGLSSEVSLKLSTGDDDDAEAEDPCPRSGNVDPQQHLQLNWVGGGWTNSANQVASMGGPLAEALRSSTSTSSPTSVLHQLPPRSSASDTSFVST